MKWKSYNSLWTKCNEAHRQYDIGNDLFHIDLEQKWVKPHLRMTGNLYLIGTRQKKKDSHCIGSLTILSWMRSGRKVTLFIWSILYKCWSFGENSVPNLQSKWMLYKILNSVTYETCFICFKVLDRNCPLSACQH